MLPLLAQGSPESRAIGSHSAGSDTTPPRPLLKPSRKQVSKACDHCRVRRVKCDHGSPCRPCRQRGLACNIRGSHNDEARTLPQALREIERLRLRVEELETELEQERRLRQSARSLPTPTQSSASTAATPATSPPSQQIANDSVVKSASPSESSKNTRWQGIFTATARSEQTSYYGPSSAFYFIGRIGTYLNRSLQLPLLDYCMQPRGVSRILVSPTSPNDAEVVTVRHGEVPRPNMSRTQEEYFISLFWESLHCNIPIIAEDEFRKHYSSLWETSRPYRRASALVDIILAVCMQYGWAFLLQDASTPAHQKAQYDDASIAGRWYYRRCQNLLASELESPSITTLQCHIFSIVYLCCGSFQNMAHTTLAVAIRTAEILGLHLEPPATMPRSERELRKRLWALVYTIEVKTCMKLGRPFSVQKSDITVSPPADNVEAASFFKSSLGACSGDVTWLTYSCQTGKFISLSVDLYDQLYGKFDEVLGQRHGCFYKDSQRLEICAEFLSTLTPCLQSWIEQLPQGIKLKRRDEGESMSVDRSPVLIEPTAPIWLQRHRTCLELIYHTTCSNLYRPFINFTPSAGSYTPTAERHAVACVNHAIAHTHIMHQVLKDSDLMNGWQEFFLWQWNATVNILGFILAHPIHASTTNARKAIEKAVEVFEVFGCNFAIAASAAAIARDLTRKADLLISRIRGGIVTAGACANNTEVPPTTLGNEILNGDLDSRNELDSAAGLQEGAGNDTSFSEFMDWALTVDSFNSFEDLFTDTSMGADWWGVSL